MQSRIKRRSMYDIVKQWGFPSDLNEFEVTYKYDASKESIEKFKSEIIALSDCTSKKKNLGQNKRRFNEYMGIIMKNESIFDKEIYLLHIARLLEEDYSVQYNSPDNKNYNNKIFTSIDFDESAKKASLVRNAKGFLSTVDVADITINENKKIKVYSSLEFSDQKEEIEKRKKNAKKQLKTIDQKIGLTKILNFFKPEELFDPNGLSIGRYQNLNYILKNIIEDCKKEERTNKLVELVRENIEYIDVDKMLALSNSRYYLSFDKDIESVPYEEIIAIKEFTETISSIILDKTIKIIPYQFSRETTFEEIEKNVNKINSHFINGKYYHEYEKDELAQNIINGKINLFNFSKEDFYNLRFSQTEITEMILKNPMSIEFLIKNNLSTIKEIKEKLKFQDQISAEQLKASLNSGVLSYNEVLKLYYNEKISVESAKKLKELLKNEKNFEDLVSSKELVKLILSKNEEKSKKYVRLYKAWVIDGKNIEERKKIANEILDYSLDLIEESKIYELYRMGLIPIDTLLDTLGEQKSDLAELFKNGVIKPSDARRLYYEGILTEENFDDLLQNMENADKLALICSIFPDTKDEKQLEIRNKLLYKVSPDIGELYGRKSTKVCSDLFKNNKKSYDYCLRWKFIANIDQDFSQEYLKQGNVMFYLPNKGKYIIEKLFTKDMKPVYGAATYVLDEIDFKNYKKNIINAKTKEINIEELAKLKSENNSVKKIVHTGWYDSMIRYFDMLNPEKYNESQINKILEIRNEIDEKNN